MKWWNVYKTLQKKRKRLFWSEDKIEQYRISKLNRLISYAYENSPFYRDFYKQHDFHPGQFKSAADLDKIPLLDKSNLRETDPGQVMTLKSSGRPFTEKDLMYEVTTGSTGKPLNITRTWRDLFYIKANDIRAFQQTGFRFNHRQVVLKSSTDSLTGKHWFERFGILQKYFLAITDTPEHNLARLKEIRPQHMHGYPNGIMAIAEILQNRAERFTIPIICSGAEVLDQHMRTRISDSFNAEVFDIYGSREVGNIAWECRAHLGLHINDDAIIVELLDDNGRDVESGVEGEVVVTHLDSYDFPFIRYRLQDRAIKKSGSCPCGVSFNRLELITGRDDARIQLPSGEWISGMIFQELRLVPWLLAFRVIQDDVKSVKLQVVPKQDVQPADIDKLIRQASGLLQNKITVIPQVLDRLEGDPSGKLRAVICRI